MRFTDLLALLALGVLWVNTLLIVAHAGLELADLGRRAARLRRGVRSGRVLSAGVLAEARTLQVGRSRGDDKVWFHDRHYESESFGGQVQTADGIVEVSAARDDAVEVWPDPARMRSAATCPSKAEFEAVYASACKARGAERVIRCTLGEGEPVWLVPAADSEPLWIAGVDPAPWIGRQRMMIVLFSIASLLLLVGCTVLALWPPVYGTVSTIGGAASLAFFLLVQPVGAAVSERVLPLHRAVLRGCWLRPAS